ncbi:cytochrome d ubiquinol oxidase subunit II [Liquorilactobacillus satsumensis]|uniref:cytochrome d ubiquinol oxidase subunit II n=1 Tax=Liquorilactobacillus satsumensis TaxID=259059 RepID=UPI0021C27F91|nr:cytochrome d ubiquinol oxidase subunit II [Liquorilactobacillus satsumensis]MCP9313660.1 cytochrome d ubiquinol oxidase subunit II [Liquorilactobacillus satsumensis]MCP9360801.1 cytochrome d ubiquinol oxidase subunit II [Liquorilactobacillus satsumensis]
MSTLQVLWFVLIGVLFSGFFFLEGFDFGVGMSIQTLAHNEKEKDQLVATIGPVWDGNEVWLITAGGAMFASYPFWYSTLFSGYYLILFIILAGLIIRGVSFEFRSKVPEGQKQLWNWALSLGSLLVPFFFGIMFISLIQGMPIDASGDMRARFGDYFNLFSLVGGVALTLMSYLHGLNYIALKTTGPVRQRAKNYAKFLYGIFYVGLLAFAALLYFKTDFFARHLTTSVIFVLLIVVLTLCANIAVFKGHELGAFLASGGTFIALVALLFTGLFPRVMISSVSAKYDLLITTASSSPYTLKIMTYIALSFLPFVLAYIAWTYYIFSKRIKHTSALENKY